MGGVPTLRIALRRSFGLALAVAGTVALVSACATGAWTRARREDTSAAYRRFLRQHPGSSHAGKAREELAYLALRQAPNFEQFERFRTRYPQSPHLAELEALVERHAFRDARADGTETAFERFVSRFPNGSLTERAKGDAAYLKADGFPGRPAALAAFVKRYPGSDFSTEASRALEAPGWRQRTALTRVVLRIEIAPGTPGTAHLESEFRERAEKAYRAADVPLVAAANAASTSGAPAGADTGGTAVLTIRYAEHAVKAGLSNDGVLPAGVLATADVTLTASPETPPIWKRSFQVRVPSSAQQAGDAIVFANGGGSFWSQFFVPVARWRSDLARRPAFPLSEQAVDVDAAAGRAVVLFGDGRFRVVDVSDPDHPQRVVDYDRPRDLDRFDRIRLFGDRVVLFGEDALEVVRVRDGLATRELDLPRGVVGDVADVAPLGDELVAAGSRGLLRLPSGDDQQPEVLLSHPVRDLVSKEGRLVFLGDTHVYVASLDTLRAGSVEATVSLGPGFDARELRLEGNVLAVVGAHAVVTFDASSLDHLRQLAWLGPGVTGDVRDAALLGGRLFLIGGRGLLAFDPRSGRLLDSVDVNARARLAAGGRHLVTVGGDRLQVVDATAWLQSAPNARPASPAPSP